jgi:uncharacterized protein
MRYFAKLCKIHNYIDIYRCSREYYVIYNILDIRAILARSKLFSVLGLLLVGTVAAASAAAAVPHFSNFIPSNVFSIIANMFGNMFSGPIHTAAQDQYMKTTIAVKNTTIAADLAVTPDQQSKGLSGRENLSENQGMLFVMKTPGKYGFWMKEMKFPLDIFWLDRAGNVVYIKENLQPCLTTLNCPTYTPDMDSVYVLETVAGFAHKYGIAKGTHFSF